MPTYENCYEILSDVRHGINEHDSSYMDATDTTCAHTNDWLVKCINKAQRYLYNVLIRRIPGEFLEETDLTASSSVFTLPWNFGRLRYFKDDKGRQVHPIQSEDRRLTNESGSDNLYYRKGNTLVLDKAGLSSTYTLEYWKKPRDIHQGKASAGAATSITLQTTAKLLADYYNGMIMENITAAWVDTIDDYTAALVATISETGTADDYYGIVSEIPEMFHTLISGKAVHIAKAESPISQEKPTAQAISLWVEELAEVLRSFAGSDLDVDPEELFIDYDHFSTRSGVIITD